MNVGGILRDFISEKFFGHRKPTKIVMTVRYVTTEHIFRSGFQISELVQWLQKNVFSYRLFPSLVSSVDKKNVPAVPILLTLPTPLQ